MKISNFRLTKVAGNSPLSWRFYALVTVTTTTKKLFRKPVCLDRDHEVSRTYAASWVFVDTGEFTPGSQVEALERSFEAKQEKDIENTFD